MLPLNEALQITKTIPPGGGIVGHEWLNCDPLNGKYDVARIKLAHPSGLFVYDLAIEPNFFFTISAEDVEMYEGADLGVQLDRFIAAVGLVIDRFDEEFR